MTIGNGVVKSNNLILLKENGGSLQLTEDWTRRVLKSMNWVNRKGTRCLPKYAFPKNFNITFSEKHWGSTEKTNSIFEKVVFSSFQKRASN